jgi:hypothetical protein
MPSLSIFPSAHRAQFLDDRMRKQLLESLEALAVCYDPQAIPEVTALNTLITKLKRGYRPTSVDYGRHYELATATMAEDVSAVRSVLSTFDTSAEGEAPFLSRWSDPPESILQKVAAERFGPAATFFHPVNQGTFEVFSNRLIEGLDFLRRCWPEMADEISILVKQILVATGSSSATQHFDGGSHYQLWGLLLLNPAFHRSPLAIAEVLVHETGHLLLFGFTTDEPLVLNPETDFFPSPLRSDPRPMDGIFHATYVSARMALTMQRIASATFLDSEIRAEARRLRDEDIVNFHNGAAVVSADADMSETGLAIFTNATRAMHELVTSVDAEDERRG